MKLYCCALMVSLVACTPARGAESPDVAQALSVSLRPARQTLRAIVAGVYRGTAARFTTLPVKADLLESVDALPWVGPLRRRAGRRFNMDDGSRDDFAICYRLSSRVGLQVVPGGAPPVKVAAKSMASSAGLAAGMTLRLSRR